MRIKLFVTMYVASIVSLSQKDRSEKKRDERKLFSLMKKIHKGSPILEKYKRGNDLVAKRFSEGYYLYLFKSSDKNIFNLVSDICTLTGWKNPLLTPENEAEIVEYILSCAKMVEAKIALAEESIKISHDDVIESYFNAIEKAGLDKGRVYQIQARFLNEHGSGAVVKLKEKANLLRLNLNDNRQIAQRYRLDASFFSNEVAKLREEHLKVGVCVVGSP